MLITKLIGGLLMPVPVVLALLSIALLLFLRRARIAGSVFLLSGLALLLALSLPPLPERLLEPLESGFPPLTQPPSAGWIVVLGGGSQRTEELPATSRLSGSSLSRLTEGLRLHQLLPEATLIFSGGSFSGGVSTAEVMAAAAESLGVAPDAYELFTQPRTTAEEAILIALRLSPGERVILVTSAFHMRRAVSLFAAQGIEVIPAPAGLLVDAHRSERHIGLQLPQSQYLAFAEIALWEYLGVWWAQLRGELDVVDSQPGVADKPDR